MTDPTGIGIAIISAIAWAYVGVALACLVAALWLPKNRATKVKLGLLVVAMFVGTPTFFGVKQEVDASSDRSAVKAACARSTMTVGDMSPTPGFYVGPEALVLVHGSGPGARLIADPGLSHVANYLVDRKMSFIEMDFPRDGSHLRRDLGWGTSVKADHPYLRMSVAPAGSTECIRVQTWLAEYPAQKLPVLRTYGLMPSHCLALEGVHELRSRYRVTAITTPAVTDGDKRFGLWEYALKVQDAETSSVPVTFPLFVGRDTYGNRWIGCDKAAEARSFERIVPIAQDARLKHLREVKVEEPGAFPLVAAATSDDLMKVGKIRGVAKVNSTNIIADDGMVWFEHKYEQTDASGSFTLRGYYLTVVTDSDLRKTVVRVDGSNATWITGLQVSPSTIRFVASFRANGPSWLVEYSSKGEPIRSLSLTPEQLEALKEN